MHLFWSFTDCQRQRCTLTSDWVLIPLFYLVDPCNEYCPKRLHLVAYVVTDETVNITSLYDLMRWSLDTGQANGWRGSVQCSGFISQWVHLHPQTTNPIRWRFLSTNVDFKSPSSSAPSCKRKAQWIKEIVNRHLPVLSWTLRNLLQTESGSQSDAVTGPI